MLPPDAIPNQLLYGLFSPPVNAPFAVLGGVCTSMEPSFRACSPRRARQIVPIGGLAAAFFLARLVNLR